MSNERLLADKAVCLISEVGGFFVRHHVAKTHIQIQIPEIFDVSKDVTRFSEKLTSGCLKIL
ncbi:hypothetical protein ACTMPN_05550 [Lacticaseibacillus paracasei]|uniref:hypothetical protein n=1 Tax=Lacticaseibacillus paracasei TaxID=1597 RepID=UPI000EB584D3|nr:hypothetical protein D9C00_04650 [Lacticaseibacillus paracasei]